MVHSLNFGNIWYNSFLSKYNLPCKNLEDEKSLEPQSFKELVLSQEIEKSPVDENDIEFNKEYLRSKLDFRKKIIENILSEKGME